MLIEYYFLPMVQLDQQFNPLLKKNPNIWVMLFSFFFWEGEKHIETEMIWKSPTKKYMR